MVKLAKFLIHFSITGKKISFKSTFSQVIPSEGGDYKVITESTDAGESMKKNENN